MCSDEHISSFVIDIDRFTRRWRSWIYSVCIVNRDNTNVKNIKAIAFNQWFLFYFVLFRANKSCESDMVIFVSGLSNINIFTSYFFSFYSLRHFRYTILHLIIFFTYIIFLKPRIALWLQRGLHLRSGHATVYNGTVRRWRLVLHEQRNMQPGGQWLWLPGWS